MSKKRPIGKQKGFTQKKVDWKALDIVHPEAVSIGWRSAQIATRNRCDASDVLPRISAKWPGG